MNEQIQKNDVQYVVYSMSTSHTEKLFPRWRSLESKPGSEPEVDGKTYEIAQRISDVYIDD